MITLEIKHDYVLPSVQHQDRRADLPVLAASKSQTESPRSLHSWVYHLACSMTFQNIATQVLLILCSEVLPEVLVPMEEMQMPTKIHPGQRGVLDPEPCNRETSNKRRDARRVLRDPIHLHSMYIESLFYLCTRLIQVKTGIAKNKNLACQPRQRTHLATWRPKL